MEHSSSIINYFCFVDKEKDKDNKLLEQIMKKKLNYSLFFVVKFNFCDKFVDIIDVVEGTSKVN